MAVNVAEVVTEFLNELKRNGRSSFQFEIDWGGKEKGYWNEDSANFVLYADSPLEYPDSAYVSVEVDFDSLFADIENELKYWLPNHRVEKYRNFGSYYCEYCVTAIPILTEEKNVDDENGN